MAEKSRANLKAAFETGDRPDGDDFADLIDSSVNVTNTSAQSLASPISVPLVAAGAVSAGTLYANVARVGGLLTHQSPYAEAYADVTAITSVEATAVWVAMSANLTAVNKDSFTVSGHALAYGGSVTAKFSVGAVVNVRLSANTNVWFGISRNGNLVSGSVVKATNNAAGVFEYYVETVVELTGTDTLGLLTQTPDGPIESPQAFGVRYSVVPVFWG